MTTGDHEADRTLSAYERGVEAYVRRSPARRSTLVDDLLEYIEVGAHVLELGSGPGLDAAALEAAGLRVDRTDGAAAFVERLRADGHDARVLDVRASDFGGVYDAIFANAVLLHVLRAQLPAVLATARRSTRTGGILAATFKAGEGEGWSTSKLDEPRHFTYWNLDDLDRVLSASGWRPIEVFDSTQPTSAEAWITVIAANAAGGPWQSPDQTHLMCT